jgi:hypothetical protein
MARTKNAGTFVKGHKHHPTPLRENRGTNRQLRRDLTIELVSQLNQMDKFNKSSREERENLHYVVENLILHAVGVDKFDEKTGKWVRDRGDLQAILALFDRLEGRPATVVTGPDKGPVQMEFKNADEVRVYLI